MDGPDDIIKGDWPAAEDRPSLQGRAEIRPSEAQVELDGPLVVRSGETANHALWTSNCGESEIDIRTNRHLTAYVVDPRTNEVVGGWRGGELLVLQIFRIAPGARVRIPLLVGTASFIRELGHSIPPGHWGLQVPLNLNDGRLMRTPTLPIVITE